MVGLLLFAVSEDSGEIIEFVLFGYCDVFGMNVNCCGVQLEVVDGLASSLLTVVSIDDHGSATECT